MDQNPKQQAAEKLRSASNVLITVSNSPNVDQLSSAIGLTLMLDKLGKHTVCVFSGEIPEVMGFLEPQKTFDTTVDGLRDFIISLSKEKADKLRYKVEEEVVKIFITPYTTPITEKDLSFSQGDFNVDVIVALGVTERDHLDSAITAHGRILHDASVISLTAGETESKLGEINWHEPDASSLAEMLVSISEALQGNLLDEQMSTALLTGIVSATERFSNTKTTPKVMTMAAQLMAAGANQQLIASNLKIGQVAAPTKDDIEKVAKINHDEEDKTDEGVEKPLPNENEKEAAPKEEDQKQPEDQKPPVAPEPETPEPKMGDLVETEKPKVEEQDKDVEPPKEPTLGDSVATVEPEKPTEQAPLPPPLPPIEPPAVDAAKTVQPEKPTGEAPNPDEPELKLEDRDNLILDPHGMGPTDKDPSQPDTAGTFNATSYEAHEEKEALRQRDLRASIMTHGAKDLDTEIADEPPKIGVADQPEPSLPPMAVPSPGLVPPLPEAQTPPPVSAPDPLDTPSLSSPSLPPPPLPPIEPKVDASPLPSPAPQPSFESTLSLAKPPEPPVPPVQGRIDEPSTIERPVHLEDARAAVEEAMQADMGLTKEQAAANNPVEDLNAQPIMQSIDAPSLDQLEPPSMPPLPPAPSLPPEPALPPSTATAPAPPLPPPFPGNPPA